MQKKDNRSNGEAVDDNKQAKTQAKIIGENPGRISRRKIRRKSWVKIAPFSFVKKPYSF